MKQIFFYFGLIILLTGCPGSHNDPAPVNTNTTGGVLFWTNDAAAFASCGALTIDLNNGQETTIIGFYNVAPTNCVNTVGGYLLVEAGTYTYTVHSQNTPCSLNGSTGTLTVTANTCNKKLIQ